jgi:uncharacterized protein involved in cysteine biosynthesis
MLSRSTAESALAAPRVGFLDGARAPWTGLAFVMGRPAIWPLAAVPVLVFLGLSGLLGWASVIGIDAMVHRIVPALAGGAIWAVVVRVLLYAVGVTLAILAGLSLAQPLSSPALDGIVRARERALGLPDRTSRDGALTTALRSLRVSLTSLFCAASVIALLFLLEIFVPGAAVVATPLKLVTTALGLAWDLLDYPLSAREHGVRARIAWFGRHWRAVVGFGASLTLVFLVPCAGFLLLPAGVAGAAELVARAER